MTQPRHIIALLTIAMALCCATAQGRTRTTAKNLRNSTVPVAVLAPDSTLSPEALAIDSAAVTLRGYSKRASDAKESFFVTNNTAQRMTQITLRLRYTTLKGELLHEREVTLPVSLKPGQTQLVSITSWDVQRLFYYYGGPLPRKSATPYTVAYRLLGYSVPVGK